MLFNSPFGMTFGLGLAFVAVGGLFVDGDAQEQHMHAANSLAYVAAGGSSGSSASVNISFSSVESLYPWYVTMEAPLPGHILTTYQPPDSAPKIVYSWPGSPSPIYYSNPA